VKLLTIDKHDKSWPEGAGTDPGQAAILLDSGDILDLSAARGSTSLAHWIPSSVRGIIGAGPEGLDIVRRVAKDVEKVSTQGREDLRQRRILLPSATTPLLAPIPNPSLIVAAGGNYGSHQKEMDGRRRLAPEGFIKSSGAVIGHGSPIVLPLQFPDMVDFEGELALVFGRACHNVSPEDAMDYIAGYTIVNDVSARNWVEMAHSKNPGEAVQGWLLNIMGKALPTFCPIGPILATCDEIRDPNDLHLSTTLNGNVMQSANTSDLVFKPHELVSHFAKWFRFRPGDLIMTGTPAGVGVARSPKLFMKAGDVVSIQIDSIGTLSNPVQ